MTNFEMIKSMSKEPLAAWLAKNMTTTSWLDEVCGAVCRSCENWTGDGCKYDLETYECRYVVDDYALFLRWLDLGMKNESNSEQTAGQAKL